MPDERAGAAVDPATVQIAATPKARTIPRHLLVLLGLTALAAFLRFWRIDSPCLWGDEALTYSRICGSLRDLIDILRNDGFTPIHYLLYWWIAQGLPVGDRPLVAGGITMTPLAMRFIPAVAGTLMVPTIYMLARQMLSIRTSLVAAALACCSAYLMVYSRDAKMYMPAWWLMSLAMACGLWWMRTRLRVAWLSFVAAGLAAVGYHATMGIPLALLPLILITSRRCRLADLLPLAVAASIMAIGPLGHYAFVSRWFERSGGLMLTAEESAEQPADWRTSGIDWVQRYQVGRTEDQLVMHSLSHFLLAWEWPKDDVLAAKGQRGAPLIEPRVNTAMTLAMSIFIAIALLGLLPWRSGSAAPPAPIDRPVEPWWRPTLWLSAWLIVPIYGLAYCRSVPDFLSPFQIVEWIGLIPGLDFHGGRPLWLHPSLGMAAAVVAQAWLFAFLRPGRAALGGVVGVGAAGMLLTYVLTEPATPQMAAYAQASRDQAWRWLLAGMVGAVVPLCWRLAGRTFRERATATLKLAAVVAVIFLLCQAVYVFWDIQREQFRERVLADDPRADWMRMWQGMVQSVWMPRYQGVVWPALCLAMAALAMRLPTGAARFAAVAVLLGANLASSLARIVVPNEPPVDRVAADIVEAMKPGSTTLTFVDWPSGSPEPGRSRLNSSPARYYMVIEAQKAGLWKSIWTDPRRSLAADFRGNQLRRLFVTREDASPRAIASEARRPQVNRIVVWQNFETDGPPLESEAEDRILAALGAGWRRTGALERQVRVFWEWKLVSTLWRREYQRLE